MATTKKTKAPAKKSATKKAPARKASGDKPKFGSPEWQAKYGKGKKKAK